MKKLKTAGIALALSAMLSVSAFALEVPTSSVVQNLNGVQQYIKTYTVSPEVDPESLIEDPFIYEGYSYTYSEIIRKDNHFTEEKQQIETVTVETEKKDLNTILEALEPTIEYDDGVYSGTLSLDHKSIQTEASEYKTASKTLNVTREIGNLDSNDMAYVPSTTVQDGVTLPLSAVDWQVQSTVLVGDLLVPSTYTAIAYYSGKVYYNVASGYVSTAEYKGTVSCDEVRNITYTVTYVGTPYTEPTPAPPPVHAEEPAPSRELAADTETPSASDGQLTKEGVVTKAFWSSAWPYVIGGAMLLAIICLAVAFVSASKKRGDHEYPYPNSEDYPNEEM